MQILSYSPSVEVYAAVGKDGGTNYYDLTPDVISANVGRKCDAASTFSITLLNKNRKYNGVFNCMDRIVIYATKTNRVKLLSGFITKHDAFKLYQSDFNISGECTLYRLQQLYFDPYLKESQQQQFADAFANNEQDNGYAKVARALLTAIGGWPDEAIDIQPELPQEVMNWASEMYAASADDTMRLTQMVKEFYEVLQTHGPKLTTTSSAGESGGLQLTGDEAKASDEQKKIVEYAINSEAHGIVAEYFACLKWVGDVYEAAGFPFARYPGAIDVWRNRAAHAAYSTDFSKIPLGACVVTTGAGSDGYGHIGIYIGNGNVISNVGGTRTETVEVFNSWATDWIDGMQGAAGWVCPDCSVPWR